MATPHPCTDDPEVRAPRRMDMYTFTPIRARACGDVTYARACEHAHTCAHACSRARMHAHTRIHANEGATCRSLSSQQCCRWSLQANACRMGQCARAVEGVDLGSTAGSCAWARAPQLTCLGGGRVGSIMVRAVDVELRKRSGWPEDIAERGFDPRTFGL